MTQTTAPAPATLTQSELYALALTGTDAEKVAAGRQAMDTADDTFDDLRGDGEMDLVQHVAANDALVLRAISYLADLDVDPAPYFGKFLAETLTENAIADEAAHWLGEYRTSREPVAADADQDLAYERNDPKHPANRAA